MYLSNATFIDAKTLDIRHGPLQVDEGQKASAAFVDTVPPGADVLDCEGKIVTKSFVVAHHHIYSALARGMPAPRVPPTNFSEILERIWWNLDKKLDAPMIRASALATAVEAAKCGVTFVIDHHSSPRAVPGSLGIIAEALEEIGLSHLLCYELSDRDGPEALEQGFAETERYLARHPGLVGLHASFTVGDETLKRAIDLAAAASTGLHVHTAEDGVDERDCVARYGRRVVERFADAGMLDSPKTLLAHGLHLDDRERALFAEGRAWLVQNAESNQNNNVGAFDPRGLGDRLLIGTDGMHSDALASVRAAYFAEQAKGGISPLGAYRRLRRAHDYLADNGFDGDGSNNLVVLDYVPPTSITSQNWPAHVLYALSRAHVSSTIAKGRLILRDGHLVGVDERAIMREACNQAERLWKELTR